MDDLSEEEEVQQAEKYDVALREIKGELKWRMKNAKRRAVPNAEGQVTGFNATAVKETILDHNDPYKVEWTEATNVDYFVGEKVSCQRCQEKEPFFDTLSLFRLLIYQFINQVHIVFHIHGNMVP